MSDGLRYLLDTNVVSQLLRDPRGIVAERLAMVGEESVCTSVIVAAELRYGAAKKASARLTASVEAVLDALTVAPLMPPATHHYAQLRDHLQRAGTPIGPNDMLIAAQALARDLTVVTANTREFARVPGLRVEDWS